MTADEFILLNLFSTVYKYEYSYTSNPNKPILSGDKNKQKLLKLAQQKHGLETLINPT